MPPGLRHAPGMMYIFRSGVRGARDALACSFRFVSFSWASRDSGFLLLDGVGGTEGMNLFRTGV